MANLTEEGKNVRTKMQDLKWVALALLLSITVRLVIISNSPSFIVGSDTPAYIAFSREIIGNHFLIPHINVIHYPGSQWIYPPALLELFAFIIWITGTMGFSAMIAVEICGIVLGSLTVIPVWKISNLLFGTKTAQISAILYAVYLPDLFVLSWGGYPQIFATFLFGWVIYYVILIARESRKFKNSVMLGLILSLLVLSHDMSFFAITGAIAFLLIIYPFYLRQKRSEELLQEYPKLLSMHGISGLIALPAFLYWYFPRIWWVKDILFPPISQYPSLQSSGIPVMTLIYNDIVDAMIPLSASAILVPLFIFFVYKFFKVKPIDGGIFVIMSFVLFPILLMILLIGNTIVFTRLAYYAYFPAFFLFSAGIARFLLKGEHEESDESAPPKTRKASLSNRKAIVGSFVVLLIVISGFGISTNLHYHSYYNQYQPSSNSNQINYTSLDWIHSNIPSSKVFASYGIYGFYIMGYDGNPTLVYENLSYLTQPVEWNESLAAYYLVYDPAGNISLTEHLINQYNISYVTIGNNSVQVPSFYRPVYKNQDITIYEVS